MPFTEVDPEKIIEVITQHTGCHIYWKNKYNNYRWCNNKLAGVLNLKDRNSIFGKTDYDLYASSLAARVCKIDRKVLKTGKVYQCEEEGLDKNQKKSIYLSMKAPLFTKTGKINGLIGISMDITERKQAELAKAEFLLSMGHDIRTPFSAILGLLGLLYANELDPEKKEWVEGILHSCEWVLSFMNDIQEIAELGYLPLNYEACDMRAVVDDIVLFSKAAATFKKLIIETHCEVKKVLMDRFRIKKILLNLLDNAIKFTSEGSITITLIQTVSALTISVSDTGMGIDEAYQEKIFEDYFQVVPCYKKQGYAGIGKGLFLVKKYTEELQGKITVQSAANEGSTFTVEIPLKFENRTA